MQMFWDVWAGLGAILYLIAGIGLFMILRGDDDDWVYLGLIGIVSALWLPLTWFVLILGIALPRSRWRM